MHGICKFIRRYKETGSIGRRPGSGRPSKITEEIKQIVEEQMRKDDETSAFQLHALLLSRGHYLSIRTILRCRTTLGWTFRGTAYCQLIREPNKLKRLEWAQKYLNEAEHGFMDVVWSDECTVQLETHIGDSAVTRGENHLSINLGKTYSIVLSMVHESNYTPYRKKNGLTMSRSCFNERIFVIISPAFACLFHSKRLKNSTQLKS